MANQYTRPPQRDRWYAPVSIDMINKVLQVSLFHPFIAWLVPLCFRAQAMPWDAYKMKVVIVYAVLVSIGWILGVVNRRLAYGLPRHVDLSEEVIVVTGGASGLGLLIAEVYGMRGATVAVLDVAELENGEARGVTYYKCDVSDPKQVDKAAKEIERDVSFTLNDSSLLPSLAVAPSRKANDSLLQLGTPTILINNAAVVIGKSLLELSVSEIEKSISTNLLAHFYTLKAFLPGMTAAEDGGTVVTVSSVIGRLGAARLTDYAAAKAGVSALHASLEAELARSHPNVRALLVEPGQLSTPLFYGVQTPNAFMAPVVEPVELARQVVAAIDSGLSGRLGAPLYARWVAFYHVLPVSWQRMARWAAGVDRGMDTFVGRAGVEKGR